MNSGQIRAALAAHLRYEKQCHVLAFERGLSGIANPDICGVLPNRYLIEYEIKISMADFRADAKKQKWGGRAAPYYRAPRLFYYAVPRTIADKVLHELPKGAGLVTFGSRVDALSGFPPVDYLRKATPNTASAKLTTVQIWTMVKHQSGTMCSVLRHYYADKWENK